MYDPAFLLSLVPFLSGTVIICITGSPDAVCAWSAVLIEIKAACAFELLFRRCGGCRRFLYDLNRDSKSPRFVIRTKTKEFDLSLMSQQIFHINYFFLHTAFPFSS